MLGTVVHAACHLFLSGSMLVNSWGLEVAYSIVASPCRRNSIIRRQVVNIVND